MGWGLVGVTENVTHHFNELQHAFIINEIKNTVGFFFAAKDVFFSKNSQMLGDVALTGADLVHNVLHADRLSAEDAQNLQSQWVRHGL